ncbi:uncharacterized protein LOC121867887 [Homarus americanus]|uniref:PAN-3 domain-containing protein n=1 Tax=Homarus americanus TaxID=6706 RepID=A0A8J5K1B4_HOMAM|nr:uncharacterized protein LOC121867887 [Homarus americanus]KAG7167757.1 hypothetical protein Hamer_G010145 [Homarus americanus]
MWGASLMVLAVGVLVWVGAATVTNTNYKLLLDIILEGNVVAVAGVESRVTCGARCSSTSGCQVFSIEKTAAATYCTVYDSITDAFQASGLGIKHYVQLDFENNINTLVALNTPTTTTTTVPSVVSGLVRNEQSEYNNACPVDMGIGAVILEKGSEKQGKIYYLDCRKFPGFSIGTTESLLLPNQTCPANTVMAQIFGYDSGGSLMKWQEPDSLKYVCKDVVGWTVTSTCQDLTVATGNTWNGDDFADVVETEWDYFFNCAENYLVVKMMIGKYDDKMMFTAVTCCLVTPPP